jgi:hypothetical protein
LRGAFFCPIMARMAVGFHRVSRAGWRVFAAGVLPVFWACSPGVAAPDPARVAEIETLLPEKPAGIGPVIGERSTWRDLAKDPALAGVVETAETFLATPPVELSDDLYLEFSKTGNRTGYETAVYDCNKRLRYYVLAECVEDKGRFLKPLEALIRALAATKTWMLPGSDTGLANFKGTVVDNDYFSAPLGGSLAGAVHLLGDRLPPEVVELVRAEVGRRLLDSYARSMEDAGRGNYWMTAPDHRNPICHAGVVAAALALEPDRARRALFVAAAERNLRPFLENHAPDGCPLAGVACWNYGFGSYMVLTELVRRATGGGVDFFTLEGVREAALFPLGLEVARRAYPTFGLLGEAGVPQSRYMRYAAARLGREGGNHSLIDTALFYYPLPEMLVFLQPDQWLQARAAEKGPPPEGETSPLRSWFHETGILVCRSAEGTAGSFGAALKAGHNAEPGGHNDVGSYTVVVGGKAVLADPPPELCGKPAVDAENSRNDMLGSFGHPVPAPAGQLQRSGREAEARVLQRDFTEERDTLVLDLAPAYEVPGLRRLERSFQFDRAGKGVFTVIDTVEFDTPSTFETALVTLGGWIEGESADQFVVHTVDSLVRVRIDTGGLEYTLRPEPLAGAGQDSARPLRLAVVLKEPATRAVIIQEIVPLEFSEAFGEGGLLGNGGFEHGSLGWALSKESLGRVTDEDAASGKQSLRITDSSEELYANVISPAVAVKEEKTYAVSGKIRRLSGEGLGVKVWCYDTSGGRVLLADGTHALGWVGGLNPQDDKWRDFKIPFRVPEHTATIRFALVSNSKGLVDVFFDDLEVVKD